jgi:hypothetical protein
MRIVITDELVRWHSPLPLREVLLKAVGGVTPFLGGGFGGGVLCPKGAGFVEAFVEEDGVDLPGGVGFDVRDIGAETVSRLTN